MANFEYLKDTTMFVLKHDGITDIEEVVDMTLQNAYDRAIDFAGLCIADGDFVPDQIDKVRVLLACIFSDSDAVRKDLDNSVQKWEKFKAENKPTIVD